VALWNQIGAFKFLDLVGGIVLPQSMAELLERPGVDGLGLKFTGTRGRPFTLHSRVDAEDLADAHQAGRNYQQLVNNGFIYSIAHQGIDYTNFGVEFAVLEVSNIRVSGRLLLMGGLFPPSLAWIEADWSLVAVGV